jgi:UDP-hydrolysing UDP-N-acetyl-D-glucosamine 2-epimerase
LISVGVVTSSRADFGYYRPLIDRMHSEPEIDHRLMVTGAHLADDYGHTVEEIEQAGYKIFSRIDSFSGDDTPAGIVKNISLGVAGFAKVFAEWKPDFLVVFGDRHDMFPAVVAALPFQIPVVHISGGELTEGAIDDALRHSMTKLSHLHFVSTDVYRDRVLQMGEGVDRVVVSGSLAIDSMLNTEMMSPAGISERIGFDVSDPFALVTFHPVTLESTESEKYVNNLLASLKSLKADHGLNTIFTSPNPDTSSSVILTAIEKFCAENTFAHLVKNAGSRAYFSLMNEAELMVGNSSSGIAEAPSFGLPVVNIGSRQAGRIRAANVIDCDYEMESITDAIVTAISADFRSSLEGIDSPFGDGHAASRIVERILSIDDPRLLLRKRFRSVGSGMNFDAGAE